MASKERFFITGAAGFVGANLCRRLVQRGEEVHALVKPTTPSWRLTDIQHRMQVHAADITDAQAVDALIERVRPTVIYHLATHGAYHYQNEAEQILLINVLGLWNLVRAANKVGYNLLINTGSSSEYGGKQFAMRETDVLDPNSFYAVAKAAQSLLCQHVGRDGQRCIVTLRLFSVYGPWEEPGRLIPNLMMSAIRGQPIDMVSANTVRDFVYVDDVVDVYLQVDKLREHSGQIINIGTGVQTSLGQLVATAGAVAGGNIQANWGQLQARTWDTNVWVADVSKLRRLTGSVPRTTVQEGLARSLAWFREHQHHYTDRA